MANTPIAVFSAASGGDKANFGLQQRPKGFEFRRKIFSITFNLARVG